MSDFRTAGLLAGALGLLMLGAAACKREAGRAGAPGSARADIQAQLGALRDSADPKWRAMTASDDQKIGITRLLLRELQALPGYDAAQLRALSQANEGLRTLRYDQQTLADSTRINRYDSAQVALLQALYPVAAPNGGAPTENARNLIEGIQQLDDGVVTFRVQYDAAAQRYNQYLRLHTAELQDPDGTHSAPKPLPLFTIGAQ